MKSGRFSTIYLITSLVATSAVFAHKPVSARYNFEEHVRPIFEEHCGGCHRPGGPTPMSLLSYNDARPWAEAIKEEVLTLRMPPWGVEDGVAFQNARVLTTKEIDQIADWATGGAPAWPGETFSRKVEREPDASASGEQDGGVQLDLSAFDMRIPIDHTLSDTEKREVVMRSISVGNEEARWITTLHFEPGNAALVRTAQFELETDGAKELILSWTPGSPPVRYPRGSARRLPPDAVIHARVLYQRPWNLKARGVSATSSLLFGTSAQAPAMRVRMFALASGESLNKGGNLLSLTPDVSVPGEIVDVRVQIGGERTPLLKTGKLKADWPIMYYLVKPLTITPRAVVEVETGTVHVEFALER